MAPKVYDGKKSIELNNGQFMPLLGLGCWQSSTGEVGKAVEAALTAGYKHIDTAYAYMNEKEVGEGIKKWMTKTGGKREDIFVVTKLPWHAMYPDAVERFLKKSLESLGLSYVDLYLVHTPLGVKGKDDNDAFPMKDGKVIIDPGTDHIGIWKAMEKICDAGLAKSIGVSNFSIKQIMRVNANARIPIAVNQVELNVSYQQKELFEYCNENNIVITAYAPLGSPGRVNMTGPTKDMHKYIPKLLEDPVVKLVANNHKVTVAQILIRFLVQSGMTTIPKSVSADRIRKNMDVFGFKLSDTEMDALRTLDKGKEGISFDAQMCPGFSDHPEYHA